MKHMLRVAAFIIVDSESPPLSKTNNKILKVKNKRVEVVTIVNKKAHATAHIQQHNNQCDMRK